MSVEVYSTAVDELKKTQEETLSVLPGLLAGVNILENVRILVSCSEDNESGSIIIKDPKNEAEVVVYEDNDDFKGEIVNTSDLRIRIKGARAISIYPIIKGSLEKVGIYLNPPNSGQIKKIQPIVPPEPLEPLIAA